MNLKLLTIIILAAVLAGCQGGRKYERLQAKVDSLELVIKADKAVSQSLMELNSLISSVSVNGRPRRHNDQPELTVDKMRAVSAYIRLCRKKIDSLENHTAVLKSSQSSYANVIAGLKNELKVRENELTMMDEVIMLSLNQNENLIHVVDLQRSEIDDKTLRLKSQQISTAWAPDQNQPTIAAQPMTMGSPAF